jgi:hypothetical protein
VGHLREKKSDEGRVKREIKRERENKRMNNVTAISVKSS